MGDASSSCASEPDEAGCDPGSAPSTRAEPCPRAKSIWALSFAGGAFDTVMQLGVAHALLVNEGAAPDFVAGISAGAVHAAALAQILQAGEGRPGHRAAQVACFREFLEAYHRAPGEMVRSLLPDAYETDARAPLSLIELPIHRRLELGSRREALRARFGLIALFNTLLELPVSVRDVVRTTFHWLAFTDTFRAPLLPFGLVEREIAWIRLVLSIDVRVYGALVIAAFKSPGKRGLDVSTMVVRRRWPRWIWRKAGGLLSWAIGAVLAALLLVGPLAAPLILLLWWAWRRLGGSRDLSARGLLTRLRRKILERYHLHRALGNDHFLRRALIRLFDPTYYGAVDADRVISRALSGDEVPPDSAPSHPSASRRLSDFAERTPSIVVAPVAVNLQTGRLEALHPDNPIIDSLLAATAVVPLFGPRWVQAPAGAKAPYIDGVNVANEPTTALMSLLEEKLPASTRAEILVYPVSPFPLNVARSGSPDPCDGLVDVGLRALELRRGRGARLERRMIALHARLLETSAGVREIDGKRHVAARIHPIEPDAAPGVASRLLACASPAARRKVMLEAVADGCRAAMETMIPGAIRAAREPLSPFAPCERAIQLRRGPDAAALPGSAPGGGPGIAEVCAACAALRGKAEERRHSLRVQDREDRPPEWPLAPMAKPAPSVPIDNEDHDAEPDPRRPESTGAHDPGEDSAAPTVSLLFGGGVFRGVFQVGVLNALDELGVKPDIIAGASVGSLTAAMAAELFSAPDPSARASRMSSLAAAHLAIDKIVLTDRFLDAIRRFALRAGETDISLADVDRLLRRYDEPDLRAFSHITRRTFAGLERLLHAAPADVRRIVGAGRARRLHEMLHLIRLRLQGWLDSMGVGEEILGAEQIGWLIDGQVLRGRSAAEDPTFTRFGAIELLITATNLTEGRLEVLGEGMPGTPQDPHNIRLIEGLLASSAYPGLFRPRWAWEVFGETHEASQYTDGGVLDNLPLDAVVRALDRRSKEIPARAARRPGVPHLILTASLECDPAPLDEEQLEDLCEDWVKLRARARGLTANRKIDEFVRAQQDLEALHEAGAAGGRERRWRPIHLEVITVKPRWLCGTFAFHPMLGFDRSQQARSIAHGCASTLATLSLAAKANARAAHAWGIAAAKGVTATPEDLTPMTRERLTRPGQCWFRPESQCPFGPERLRGLPAPEGTPSRLHEARKLALAEIYTRCGEPATHRAP